jgi:hypothetical protein
VVSSGDERGVGQDLRRLLQARHRSGEGRKLLSSLPEMGRCFFPDAALVFV